MGPDTDGSGMILPKGKKYQGQTVARVQFAPERRAFIVQDGNHEQLRAAILAASTIWGGMRCPIIPVSDEGAPMASAVQIAEVLNTDIAIDFTVNSQRESVLKEPGKLPWPLTGARPLQDGTFWSPHPMLVLPSDHMRHVQFTLPETSSLVRLAGAGHVALPEELRWWRDSGANILENAQDTSIARAQIGEHTAIAYTATRDVDVVVVAPWPRAWPFCG